MGAAQLICNGQFPLPDKPDSGTLQNIPFPMLLAAGWIEAVGPLILVVFWLLCAFMTEKQQPAQPPVLLEPDDEPPVRQQRPRPQGRAREPEVIVMGPGQGRPAAGDLRTEVEDFLRRVGEMRTAPEQPPKPKPQPEPARRGRQKPTPANRPAARKESVNEPSVSRGATVSAHVQQHVGHLPESQLAEQAARLGAELSQTDERLEQRLQQKFDHKVGTLASGTLAKNPGATPIFNSPAQEIAAMLARPDSMRNAIVLGEIMKRPSDDW